MGATKHCVVTRLRGLVPKSGTLAALVVLIACAWNRLPARAAGTDLTPVKNNSGTVIPGGSKRNKASLESVKPFKALYAVENGAIVSHNGAHFFNRPLYAPNIPAMSFAGDKPQMRLIDAEYCYGTLLLGYARGESSKWLHECDNITTRFYPARVVWETLASASRLRHWTEPGTHPTIRTVRWSGMGRCPDGAGYMVRQSMVGTRT